MWGMPASLGLFSLPLTYLPRLKKRKETGSGKSKALGKMICPDKRRNLRMFLESKLEEGIWHQIGISDNVKVDISLQGGLNLQSLKRN